MHEALFTLVPQSAGLEKLVAQAKAYAVAASAESSRRAQAADWNDVESWCRQHGVASLSIQPSPEVVSIYLADKAAFLSPQTLTRRLSSISQALRAAGFDGPSPASMRQPLVGSVLRGIRRAKGVAPGPNQKAPLLTEDVKKLVATCGNDLQGIRDKALILLGFAGGGIRRAELVAIDRSMLVVCESGVVYHAGRSKTDQEGVGRKVGIPWGLDPETCAVRALQRWLDAALITSGPVFRAISQRGIVAKHGLNPASAAYIVKHRARLAGLDDSAYGAHSLRSGFCTQSSLNKVGDRAIMKQSGHKCSKSLDRYVRIAGLFNENAAASLGL